MPVFIRPFYRCSFVAFVCLTVICFMPVRTASAAAPAGYNERTLDLGTKNGALTFSPNGTLYVVEGVDFGDSSNTIKVVNPDGTPGADIQVTGTSFQAVGGIAWYSAPNPANNRLLVTDNFPGRGDLYSINPANGVATLLANGIPNISEVVVGPMGQILVSDAGGVFDQDGFGKVDNIDPVTGAVTPVVSNLALTAGLGFRFHPATPSSPPSYDLVVQESHLVPNGGGDRTGRISFSPITVAGDGSLQYGAPTLIADNVTSQALAVDATNDIFSVGSGGLQRIDGVTGAVTNVENNGDPFQFATDIDLLSGPTPFQAFTGSGTLAYIPDFNSNLVVELTPVPEPTTLALLATGGLLVGVGALRLQRRSLSFRRL